MAATGYVSTTGDARKVDVAGDTMTGELILEDASPAASEADISTSVTAHAAAADPHGDRAYADGLIAALGDAAALDVGTSAGTVAGGGHVHSQWTPAGHGVAAWTFDPAFVVSGNGQALPAAGVLQLMGVVLDSAATIASVALAAAGTAGATLTNSFVGLYDSGGTLRASTADQSSSWQSTGFKNPSFSSPYAAPAGRYWIALLVGSAVALPSFHGSPFGNTNSSGLINIGLSAAAGTLRWGQYGSGQTSLPASITPASMVTTTVRAYWAALLT